MVRSDQRLHLTVGYCPDCGGGTGLTLQLLAALPAGIRVKCQTCGRTWEQEWEDDDLGKTKDTPTKSAPEWLPEPEGSRGRGPRGGLGLSAALATKLFPEEVERFRAAAEERGISPTEMLRQIVRHAARPLYYVTNSDPVTGEPTIVRIPDGHTCCQPPVNGSGGQCRYGHTLDTRPRDRCLVCHRQREAIRRKGERP